VPRKDWYSVNGIGNSFSVHLSGQAKANTFQVLAFDLAYEAGMAVV
jgi:hypothetical protein